MSDKFSSDRYNARIDMSTPGADEPPMDESIPAVEIEAAANALQMLWECARSKEAQRYSGHGPSWRAQAQAALTAAKMVHGKQLQANGPDLWDAPN